jgi:hypothetical protein
MAPGERVGWNGRGAAGPPEGICLWTLCAGAAVHREHPGGFAPGDVGGAVVAVTDVDAGLSWRRGRAITVEPRRVGPGVIYTVHPPGPGTAGPTTP